MLNQEKLNPVKTSTPLQQTLTLREKFVSSIIAFIGLVLVGLVSMNTIGLNGLPFMVASMGASSVLLFAVPYSPLSQPWPFLGGHLVSSCVGVSCALFIPDPVLAAAAAVSLAIAAMHVTQCLHPPGGAIALAAVLGGEQVQALGYTFVLFPVMLNALLLLGAVLLLNNMVPGRRYPSKSVRVKSQGDRESWSKLAYGISSYDLRSAINSLDEFVDITEEQLDKLYKATIMQMRKRQLGDVRCEHVMSKDVISVKENTPLSETWQLLQNGQVKAVPVLDPKNRVCGTITQLDLANMFMDKICADLACETNTRTNTDTEAAKHFLATPVGVVMNAPVTTIGAKRHIVEAIPLVVERKIRHIPVVDRNRVIVGMLTKTDLLTLLEPNSRRIE
jgi:CBS domain-containing membrane protein